MWVFDRLRALNQRQQVLLVTGAVAGTAIILSLIWFAFLRVEYLPLFTQLRPTDAATIVADLERRKLPYRVADDGSTILVPADEAAKTRLDVMTEDLPLKGTVGFELFDKSDMGLTDFAQKINYQRALQGELERTIATLDGVDSARVHLSLGEDRIFRDDRVPPTASVTIRMQKGSALATGSAQGIQRLIAAAVPNLEAANVVILDEKGRVIGSGAAVRSEQGPISPADQERHAIEQYYQARARAALDRAYPLGGIAVGVSADLENGTGGAAAPSLPDWNPAARSFPLKVTLSTSLLLDAQTRDTIRGLVGTAIGVDPSKNDEVDFRSDTSDAAPAAAALPSLRPNAAHETAELAAAGENWAPVATLGVFLVLAGLGFAFVWRLRRPNRLSEVERGALAKRFRDLLGEGGGHAAS